jgi:hypothetical protein
MNAAPSFMMSFANEFYERLFVQTVSLVAGSVGEITIGLEAVGLSKYSTAFGRGHEQKV